MVEKRRSPGGRLPPGPGGAVRFLVVLGRFFNELSNYLR